MRLRDYQEAAIEALQQAYSQRKRAPVFVCATGSGKTVILSEVAKRLERKGTRSCIVVHRQELIDQTAKALGRAGVRYGIIAPGHTPRDEHLIQIASVNTLPRRINKIKPFDFLLLDESHHAVAPAWGKVLEAYSRARIMGVTATPCRTDGTPLNKVFDEMVEGPSISDLIDRGFLSPAKVFAPPSDIDYKSVHLKDGDFNMKDVEGAVSKTTVIGNAVQHYRKHCDGQPALVFCVSIKHAETVAQAFRDAGYRAEAVSGDDTKHDRKNAISGLAAGHIDVLTSCAIFSEGTDIPRASCAILLRPTMSLSLYLQMVGRVLRPIYALGMPIDTDEERLAAIALGEKPHAVILDHCGNVARHGIHCEEREWSLTQPQKKPKKDSAMPPGMRLCPKCDAVVRSDPESQQCPECGYAWPKAKTMRHIIEVDGELVEFSAQEKTGEAKVYETLKEIATHRGYKGGWAYHMRQARKSNGHYAPVERDAAESLSYRALVKYVTGREPVKANANG